MTVILKLASVKIVKQQKGIIMKKEFLEVQWFDQMKLDSIEESGNKKYIISGPFTRCDYPNGNNRIYPREVMQKAIDALKPKVESGRVRMMVDHPMWDASMRSVGAIVTSISDVDAAGYAYYTAQIVDTAAGKDLKAIVDAGGKLGVSTRGYGSAMYDQEYPPFAGKFDVIQAGYDLRTFDFVDDPSVSDTEAYCQIESKRRSNPMKNIDELKSAYPELLESYKANIESELKKAIDEAKAQAETEKGTLVAEKNTLVESNKKLSETVKALSESIKSVCPELFTVVEESKLVEEANSATDAAKKELTEAKAEVAKLQEEIQGIKATAVKEARDAQIKQLEATNPEMFKLKSFEKMFENCVTVDEVNAVFEKNNELYKQIKAEANEPAPAKSVVEGSTKPESTPANGGLNESQYADYQARNKQRRLSGMTDMTIESYKKNFVK